MTDKTMTFRIGDDHEDVMKETLKFLTLCRKRATTLSTKL